MRKYLSNILFALVAVFAAGCVEVNIYPVEPQTPATVTLQLRNTDLVATRVDVNVTDDSNNNEDRIQNVQCFFTSSTDDDTIIYSSGKKEFDNNISGSTEITISDIPANIFQSLSKVYVVANYAGDLTKETSINDIMDKDITLDDGVKQPSFVMDGASPLNRTGVTTVDLERVAAKIVVKVSINNEIEEDGHSWEPVTDKIKMTYTGGIVASKISAETVANTVKTDGYTQVSLTGEKPSTVFSEDRENSTDAKYIGYQTVPFYSFPVAAGDVPEGEITMTIPWTTRDGENASTIEYTYEIPVEIAFERNKVYIIDVEVNVLGAPVEKTLTPSYIVLDWNNTPIDATLSKPQYLVVDQNYVVMNNVEEISVGYSSSDEVVVELIQNPITSNNIYGKRDDFQAVFQDVELGLDTENTLITLSHNLDNTREGSATDPKEKYDFRPQEFLVKVYHKNNPAIFQEIKFVQYPAMYMQVNSGDLSNNNYVFVNANNKYSQGGSNSGDVLEWESVGKSSTNFATLYTITVSSFDASTANYIIADPRVASNTTQITQFPGYKSSGRTQIAAGDINKDASGATVLKGYRRTIQGSESVNLVAPSFVIASACGTYINGDGYIHPETSGYYRCASYQEDGRPAGRWRIPTPAELNVVGRLCAEGKITETIFKENVSYMSSDGPYTYNKTNSQFTKNNNSETSSSIRCLYDIWYWKDECKTKSQFIWGAEGNIADLKSSEKYDTFLKSVE